MITRPSGASTLSTSRSSGSGSAVLLSSFCDLPPAWEPHFSFDSPLPCACHPRFQELDHHAHGQCKPERPEAGKEEVGDNDDSERH